ncbi:F0F1 ATP synthase subunit delta [Suttonella ornithocola]|uniref:ATP synthase subunit delta n=1 Tax=Suttonella ornithocola TaxID=279832 RepID=A0A380MTX1_9GAMM|nr:F0F1 ATP synthase subunit delta [Suttonella ornithocola]SUO96015.1 F-type ATPase subunit delta [Suttonella ornithocola]
MSQSETIARPYAKAIFEQTVNKQSQIQWQEFLTAAADFCQSEIVLARLFAPGFYDEFVNWLEQYLVSTRDSKLTKEERNLLHILRENDRLSVLPEIALKYDQLLNESEGMLEATVYSAKSLTSDEEKKISLFLEKKTNKKIVLKVKEQPSLLAGLRIEYDGLVIDQSTRGRIEQFARKLDDLRN